MKVIKCLGVLVLLLISQVVYSQDIIDYAKDGDLSGVKKSIKQDVNINITDKFGYTALMHASEQGHVKIVKYLVEKGSDINTKNETGWTALMAASWKGHLAVAKYLVENGADVNAKNKNGWTALIIASRYGKLEVVKFLVDNGADIHVQENYGNTALMFATDMGNEEIVKYLASVDSSEISEVNSRDDEYTERLNSMLKNTSPAFKDIHCSKEYLQLVNEIDVIVSSELRKPLELRDYEFISWYVDQHLFNGKKLLNDKYVTYDDFIVQIETIFPNNEFSTQLYINFMESLETAFYQLIIGYYEMQYLASLDKKQLKLANEEKKAWQEYRDISFDVLDKLYFGEGSGSMSGMFKAGYKKYLYDQYARTSIDYYFNRANTSSDFEIDDKLIVNAYKYFSLKNLKDFFQIDSEKEMKELQKSLKKEETSWNNWMKIRASYSKLLKGDELVYYNASTERLKKMKLIDLKNLYSEYSIMPNSSYDMLLKKDSSKDEILKYDFINIFNL